MIVLLAAVGSLVSWIVSFSFVTHYLPPLAAVSATTSTTPTATAKAATAKATTSAARQIREGSPCRARNDLVTCLQAGENFRRRPIRYTCRNHHGCEFPIAEYQHNSAIALGALSALALCRSSTPQCRYQGITINHTCLQSRGGKTYCRVADKQRAYALRRGNSCCCCHTWVKMRPI